MKDEQARLLPVLKTEPRFLGHTARSVFYFLYAIPAPSFLKYIVETVINIRIESNYVRNKESLKCRPTNMWLLSLIEFYVTV
jgi:hypothetical protein